MDQGGLHHIENFVGEVQAAPTERDRQWMALKAAAPLRGRVGQTDQAGLDLFDPPLI